MEQAEVSHFEESRKRWAQSSPNELAALILEHFNADYPPEGLYSGTWRDRVIQFVADSVQPTCKKAGDLGHRVWIALHDDHTAHEVERFALVCGFFASEIFPNGRWPAHEIAAMVLLVVALVPPRSKGN